MVSTGNVLRLPSEEGVGLFKNCVSPGRGNPKWGSKCPVEIEKPPGSILSFFFLFLFIYFLYRNNI
jgi:hypothetical protein